MFKFIKAMQEAVDLGVAEPEDLVPDWSRKRLHNKSLQSIRSQRNDVQASDTDVGVSKNLDWNHTLYEPCQENPLNPTSNACAVIELVVGPYRFLTGVISR